MLRLGILCAGIGSFAVALFAAINLNIVEEVTSEIFGNTVIGSVVNSMHEELGYLPRGLKEAVPGEDNDIFDDVFTLGDEKNYDYSKFASESRSLPVNGVNFTLEPAIFPSK